MFAWLFEISSPSLCICIVCMAKSLRGSFATESNFELLSIMRRPRQQGQHISSLNCCSRPCCLGPRHSTMLSTSWLVYPSIFMSSLVWSIKKQLSSEKGIGELLMALYNYLLWQGSCCSNVGISLSGCYMEQPVWFGCIPSYWLAVLCSSRNFSPYAFRWLASLTPATTTF